MRSMQAKASSSAKTPVHLLGISQIISYGMLFYAFAALKSYLAAATGLDQSVILTTLSAALIVQALIMPLIGHLCDRIGALHVMRFGFLVGAIGMFGLGLVSVPAFGHWLYLLGCFAVIGVGLAMSTYEMAFGAAVQINEAKSRRNISIITFYGGVASSLTWMSIHPLLSYFGLFGACCIIAAILTIMGLFIRSSAYKYQAASKTGSKDKPLAGFSWQGMKTVEKGALILLASSGALEYVLFSATTLLWISWFELKFDNLALAVLLASTYGPFQTVGRALEMLVSSKLDARITSLIACLFVPASLLCIFSDQLYMSFLAMALFGMGHGVLTVSFGFITNLYFRAEVYGRAKGIIATPRVIGSALGPSIGGLLFAFNTDIFMSVMIGISLATTLLFFCLLFLQPTNPVHLKNNSELSKSG